MTTIFFCIGHRLLFQLGHFELDYVSNCYMKYDFCHAIQFVKIIVPNHILQSVNHKHGKIGYYMKIKLYNFQDIFCVIAQKI